MSFAKELKDIFINNIIDCIKKELKKEALNGSNTRIIYFYDGCFNRSIVGFDKNNFKCKNGKYTDKLKNWAEENGIKIKEYIGVPFTDETREQQLGWEFSWDSK